MTGRFARPGLVAVAVALGLAGACAPIADPPAPVAPINACPEHPCGAYTQAGVPPSCSGDVCVVNNRFDFVLAVTLPGSSLYAPGMTFLVRDSELLKRPSRSCPLLGPCPVKLPVLGESHGGYNAEPSAEQKVGRWLGNAGRNSSVPVHVSFRLLWSAAADPSPSPNSEAILLGLMTEPTFARVLRNERLEFLGPGGVPNIGYDAPLPAGVYERTMLPDPPFDDSYPPHIEEVAVTTGEPAGPTNFNDVLLGNPTTRERLETRVTHVSRDAGSLEGFAVFLRDSVTRRTISTTVHLPKTDTGTGADVTLYTIMQGATPEAPDNLRDSVELVVEPSSPGLPELALLAVTNTVPVAAYPAVYGARDVTGAVVSGGVPVTADIVFVSTEITPVGDPGPKHDLHYDARAEAGTDGTYRTSLPPGKYDAIVTPRSDAFAMTVQSVTVVAESSASAMVPIEMGRVHAISGTATLADGRALAGGEVEAHASTGLLARGGGLAEAARDRRRWPRTRLAGTDADGHFSLGLDPGVYDIVVRPSPGSRLPWVTQRMVTVTDGDVALPTVVVPAPFSAGRTLRDAFDRGMGAGTLVRAYAFSTEPSVAIEIGRATTDESGHFELFVTGLAR